MTTINEIYAYGDSFTAGDGVASSSAWPNKLGKLLKIPVSNRGVPGGSNKLSIINLLNDFADIKNPEQSLVVFSWTGISRTAVYFEEKKTWENILMGHEPYEPFVQEKKKLWFGQVYNDYEGLMEYYSQQIFVSSFLKSRNVPYVFMNSFLENYIVKESFDTQYQNMVKLLPVDRFVHGHDKSIYQLYCVDQGMTCKDGYHPSVKAHRLISKDIKAFLENLKWQHLHR